MIDNCSIAEIRLFRTAALQQSISKAAKAHHLSQSAASTAIARLEKALNLPLLEHGKNRFQLTPHGYKLLACLEKFEQAIEEIKNLGREPQKGPWRLALSHSLAVALLPKLLKHMNKVFPGIHIEVHIGHALEVAELISKGEQDMALIVDQNDPLPCERMPIFAGRFCLYSKTPCTPGTPILLDSEKKESVILKSLYEKRFQEPFPTAMNIASWEVIAALAESGTGVGFLPDIMQISHPHLKAVDWSLETIPYEISVLTRKHASTFGMQPLIDEFKKFMSLSFFHPFMNVLT